MKFLLVLCFAVLFSFTAFGQDTGSVSGLVMVNDVPVAGATVTITDSGGRSQTVQVDAAGKFAFAGLKPGPSKISAALGSRTTGREIVVESGQQITLDLDLVLDARRIYPGAFRELVTIAADAGQPLEEISKSVNVIGGQEMRERADITLADSLRTIPGFRVQQLGGFGRTASIKSRGLRNQDTAVLLDGVRLRDAASITGDATAFISDLTLTSVSRVEVLRGPGSSLYGTNAIGGTVDLQTPLPQEGWHGQVSGALGGLGMGRFRGNVSHGTDKFGFNAALSRTVFTEGIDGDDDARNTNFQSRVEVNPFDRTNISARFFVSDAFVALNSSPDTLAGPPASNFGVIDAVPGVNFAFDANDPDNSQRSRFFNGQIVLTHAVNSRLSVQAYYSGLRTRRVNDNGPLGVGFQNVSTSLFEGVIHTANAHFDWAPVGGHQLTAGYEFEDESFRNDNESEFAPFDSTRAGQRSNTAFFQYLAGFLDGRLQLAGGARAQFFSLRQPRFSLDSPLQGITLENPPAAYTFDGSASYFFRSTNTKLRTHAGNGYRVPSLYERFVSFTGFLTPDRLFLAGYPDLKSERSVGFDAGVEQGFWKGRIRLTGVYFYTALTDTINYGTFPEPDPFGRDNLETFGGYLNSKGYISRGGEFSVAARPTGSTDVFASYTLTRGLQREPQVGGSGVLRTLGVPDHQFTFNVTQRIKRFWVNADFVGTSSYLAPIFSNFSFNTYVYRFEGNRRLDLTAGYTFSFEQAKYGLRLFGTLENVFDREYLENGFRTPGRNGRVGLSFTF